MFTFRFQTSIELGELKWGHFFFHPRKINMPKHLFWFLSLFFSSWMRNLTNSMLKITQEWVYKVLREWSSGQVQLLSFLILLHLSWWSSSSSLHLFPVLDPQIPLRLNHVKHWEEKRHCVLFPWMSPPKLLAVVLIFISLEFDPEKKALQMKCL